MTFTLKCLKCGIELQESLIQESHDVPCYLFEGNRKGQKNQADKFGRHHLCEKCHKEYESLLRKSLQETAFLFAKLYFKKEGENDSRTA